eukprot:COSAG03_NODE_12768_length_532_cov_0.364896_1_plen_49_part_10
MRASSASGAPPAPTHDQLGSHEQELELAVRRRRQRAAPPLSERGRWQLE